jgi:cation diffusion facilitator family transporter
MVSYAISTRTLATTEKMEAARNSIVAAVGITLLKLFAGITTGSLGMLSDALHSGLDLTGATLTYFSVRMSSKPADDDHTYGHGKFENMSAFAETLIMAVTAVWIIAEAAKRIFWTPLELRHSLWPVLVLIASMSVDFWRSRRLMAVAKKHNSAALRADALHFASDIWASMAVLVGLLATWVGGQWHLKWLDFADPMAAMCVSVMILRISWQMARETLSVLLDSAPAETRKSMLDKVAAIHGVLAVEQARIRRAGSSYFADLTIALPRGLSFQRSEQLVEEATSAVHSLLPDADVVIHTVPRETKAESIFDRVRAIALRADVSVHDLSVQSTSGHLQVEQHLELPENMLLRDAHDFVCHLESEILKGIPEIDAVLTHIESLPATIEDSEDMIEERERIEQLLQQSAARLPEILDVHAVSITRLGQHLSVSCHCTLPDDLPMSKVHEVITELEDHFKLQAPEVYRVLIHPEPVTDNIR